MYSKRRGTCLSGLESDVASDYRIIKELIAETLLQPGMKKYLHTADDH